MKFILRERVKCICYLYHNVYFSLKLSDSQCRILAVTTVTLHLNAIMCIYLLSVFRSYGFYTFENIL